MDRIFAWSWWLALAAMLEATSTAGQVTLSERTVEAGLLATHHTDDHSIPAAQDWMTGGLGVGDFNRDGWMDIYWVGGGATADKLFINDADGRGTFTDQADAWGLTDFHSGNGVAVADYDGDGWPDIYVTSFGLLGDPAIGSHRLYRNNGGSFFTDVARDAGVNRSCERNTGNPAGYGAAFGDYDLDGDLDLFVSSWWAADEGQRLFRNDGDGTFTDVTSAAIGKAVTGVWGFQPAFVDMNGDRFPEILLAADFVTSRYFVNNGDGTFDDQTLASGTGLDQNGMGQTVADFDNDGLLDWYVTAIYAPSFQPPLYGNRLYMHSSDHVFREEGAVLGADDGRWGWGTVAIDLDHDTWVDILEVNGRPAMNSQWINQPARLFHNDAGASFREIAAESGFDHADEGRGIAYLDADGDGDLDVVVSTNNGPLMFYRNETIGGSAAFPRNWLRILFDTSNNKLLAPDGYGTRVEARVGSQTYVKYMSGSPSYLANSEPSVHFGLGAAMVVDELRIEWSRGYVTVMSDVAVNQHLTIAAPELGDINSDGMVGVDDLLIVLADQGACPAVPDPCLADLDDSGDVGIDDLRIFVESYARDRRNQHRGF